MDAETKYQRWVSAIDQVQAETGIRNRERAAVIAASRYPELADAVPAWRGSRRLASAGAATPLTGASTSGASAEAELESRARQYQSEHPGTSFAQAYVAVLNSDTSLYLRYLQQQQAKLAAEARPG